VRMWPWVGRAHRHVLKGIFRRHVVVAVVRTGAVIVVFVVVRHIGGGEEAESGEAERREWRVASVSAGRCARYQGFVLLV
jgi:hypothetical protein